MSLRLQLVDGPVFVAFSHATVGLIGILDRHNTLKEASEVMDFIIQVRLGWCYRNISPCAHSSLRATAQGHLRGSRSGERRDVRRAALCASLSEGSFVSRNPSLLSCSVCGSLFADTCAYLPTSSLSKAKKEGLLVTIHAGEVVAYPEHKLHAQTQHRYRHNSSASYSLSMSLPSAHAITGGIAVWTSACGAVDKRLWSGAYRPRHSGHQRPASPQHSNFSYSGAHVHTIDKIKKKAMEYEHFCD